MAFVWQNQSPPIGGSAGDPSFAVDDITLSTPIPTPIELISFTGKELTPTSNLLEWITSSEINNNFFTLERSEDALNFEPIATIKGAGNSNTLEHYSFIDNSLPSVDGLGWVYYRLKQTDFDGQFEYFDVIAIAKKNTIEPIVYYYNKQLHIKATGLKEIKLKIIDVTGRIIYETTTFNSIVNLNQLAKGIYIYQINLNNTILSNKIVVNQ
ncbi:MAG: T9SS type A sorting domain-containing protein [Vicingaceae bacterium]|nr:T9SS type A sorting domain-containing protein [Vicingaceae bacterium]